MLVRQWLRSLLHCTMAGGSLVYALYFIHNAWGMVILAWCYVAGFLLLVNTVDLLTGGRLRRGPRLPTVRTKPVMVRRIILEEITPLPTGDPHRV